jgi:hypothetical protein
MFELNDLLAGSYRLAVAAPSGSGYRWQWYGSPTGARGDATPQEVALCNEWNELGVTLDDAGSMAGTVFFATGAPAVGTRVAAYEQGVTWLPEAVVTTSADGTFAFDDLPVGSYQLLLTAPAGVNRPAVWLGGPRRGKATVHQVTAGGSITGVDATLPYDDDVPAQTLLSGTVQHESGTPAAGATVAAYGTTNGVLPHATVTVATDGTFAFDDLAPDTYRLLVRAPSGPETTLTQYWHAEPGETDRSRSAAAAIEVPADDDVTGVTVVYPSS